MKNVVITGATGFIGKWLIKELTDNGLFVTVIVRNKTKLDYDFYDKEKIRIIEKDINDVTSDDFMNDIKYDCFYHLAWDGVSTEKKNDIDLQINNLRTSMNALELCKRIGADLFIATGTVAEYVFSKNIINLNEKQTPNDIYGAAKTSAHYLMEVYARQLEQKFIWAVLPSTFGEYRNDNNIITYTICTLLQRKKPKYGNLNQIWDFLYVADVVKALRLLGEKGKCNSIYGIGSGIYKPLYYYITTIRNIINPNLELGIGELAEMSDKTFSSCVDIKKIVTDTGFKPTVSFEEGIERTIRYWEKSMNI